MQITLKFTIAKGWASNLLYWVFKHPYTHTAISLDDITFYSFTNDGFTLERKRRYIPKEWNGVYAYYYLNVSEEIYYKIYDMILEFKEKKEDYHYSYLTIIGAFFNLSFTEEKKYTCSQFVAMLLQKSKAFPLKRKANLYLPYQLIQEMQYMTKKEEHLLFE